MTDHRHPHRRPRGPRRRAALAVLGIGGLFASSGAWAVWQSTGSLDQAVTSATVTVNVTDAGSGAATWATDIDDLLPGDYFHRWMDVQNTGSVAQTFAGTLSGTATLPGALTAWVSSCDVAFTSGTTTCPGTQTDLLGTTGSPAAFGALSSLGSIASGSTLYLAVRFEFDAAADQGTYENQASTLTLAVTGTATAIGDRTNG